MKRKKAFKLSIKKWKYIVRNDGSDDGLLAVYRELKSLEANCGLCEKYIWTSNKKLEFCAKCPIRLRVVDYDRLSSIGCYQNKHPFRRWRTNPTKENAKKVLKLIKSER